MNRSQESRPTQVRRQTSCVEALQPRTLLSVTPALAAKLEAAGYEKTSWQGQDVYVEPGEWIVSFQGLKGTEARRLAEARARVGRVKGLAVAREVGASGFLKVTAPAAAGERQVRAALARVRGARLVEPNFAVWAQGDLNDPRYGDQYALHNTGADGGLPDADIDAPEAWAIGAAAGMEDVVVGVIDTGVDYTHPDLAANMWTNPFETPGNGVDDDGNGFVDDVHGADFAHMDGDPMDDHGHGTHVAGIIAAAADNGIGVAGAAPNAKIMALRFLTADGFGSLDGAIDALTYAADMKSRGVNVRLTNNSWGGVESSVLLESAVRASGNNGLLYVAASGNGGEDGIGDNNDLVPFYPSNIDSPNVLAVTATGSSDTLGALANYGATTVHLAAPGLSVLSTMPNNTYVYGTGTSMAAPHVSAAAAMAFGVAPSATWQLVRAAIVGGVDVVPSLAGRASTGGRLNAANTLRRMLPPSVVGRHVFYNNSAFDGRDAAANAADDAAIATDKAALRPGEAGGFANYTSYSRGINGVMVDVRNAPAVPGAQDFQFAVGGAAGWLAAPAPGVSVRFGAGTGGSDRVTFTWADNAIRDTWLRVTVLSGDRTGLSVPDVFYFGNAVGETGNSAAEATVNALDVAATRAAATGGAATLETRYDFNRDALVNVHDFAIVRGRQGTSLPPLTAPLGGAPVRVASGAEAPATASVRTAAPRSAYLATLSVAGLIGIRS